MKNDECDPVEWPGIPDATPSSTVQTLMAYFFKLYCYGGEEALPCQMEIPNPPDTDGEYGDKVLVAFANKPNDYEAFLTKRLNGRRNSKQYKRENPDTELVKARKGRKKRRLSRKRRACFVDSDESDDEPHEAMVDDEE